MIVNADTLDLVFKGFKTVYTDAYLAAEVHWDKIAMTVPSQGADETYGWLGHFPQLREWIGPRHVQSLKAHGFTITNRDFESTVAVRRNSIADDKLGVFKPAFSEMGQLARLHPEELIMGLLANGFTEACFDGQSFFDTEHPVTTAGGTTELVSNMQDGAGPAWFLLDTSRAVRPLIWQERQPYEFTSMTDPTNPHVFMNAEFIYGVHARVNAGFGLWQLGFGSKAALDVTNYAAARAAMMDFRADGGRKLGITPKVLVVPPELEEDGLKLVNATNNDAGATNVWAGTARLIVSPWLSA